MPADAYADFVTRRASASLNEFLRDLGAPGTAAQASSMQFGGGAELGGGGSCGQGGAGAFKSLPMEGWAGTENG